MNKDQPTKIRCVIDEIEDSEVWIWGEYPNKDIEDEVFSVKKSFFHGYDIAVGMVFMFRIYNEHLHSLEFFDINLSEDDWGEIHRRAKERLSMYTEENINE